jgi:co-chaperonin GroES (HSP10)
MSEGLVNLAGRRLIVVGDRVLVRSEEGESVTSAGLILPASVADREAVQVGRIVAVGPGFAVSPSGFELEDEWKRAKTEPRYVAMQAAVGDIAVFFRKAAVEITVDAQKLFVVPHAAILVLLRDELAAPPQGPQ